MSKNLLIVLSGPSGVGKGTIAKRLLESDDIAESVSCTTREKREGETDGKEYFFITREQFESKLNQDGFLEYSKHFDNYYGTPKQFVLNTLKNKNVLLEIDVNGALSVKKSFPEAILIMIAPPRLSDLRDRLHGRNTESEDKIELRIARSGYELSLYKEYDYTVINDNLNSAVEDVKAIIRAEKVKSVNQQKKISKILEV